MKTLTLGTFTIIAIAAQPCPAGNLAKTLGFYDWGGQYVSPLSDSVQMIVALGSRAARISLSPRYDLDYHQATACSAADSLEALIQQPDVKAALDNANIDVFMLTAYDFTTFGDCQTQRYLVPQSYTPENV